MNKKGDLLTGEVIFLILNVIILAILVIFVLSKTNGTALAEEQYAKEIALMMDSAKPGMIIHLNMEDAINKAKSENQDPSKIVRIEDNIVTVKLRDQGGYSYSFFNSVNASASFSADKGEYVFVVNKRGGLS